MNYTSTAYSRMGKADSGQREITPDHKLLSWKWHISRQDKWMEDQPSA